MKSRDERNMRRAKRQDGKWRGDGYDHFRMERAARKRARKAKRRAELMVKKQA